MIGETIAFIHLTTGERKAVPVETVVDHIVTVRWPMAGLYELDLRTNTLKAYQQKSRRAHQRGALPWKAEDIAAVRRMAKIEVDGEDRSAVTERLSAAHRATMPGNAPVSGADAMIARLRRSSTYGKG